MKCPNCGAPMSSAVCDYCGAAREQALPSQSLPGQALPERMVQSSRGKRNLLDKILIALGALWCGLTLAAMIDLRYTAPIELAAGFMLASPGIVLLLIGFRRKKNAGIITKKEKPAPEEKRRP